MRRRVKSLSPVFISRDAVIPLIVVVPMLIAPTCPSKVPPPPGDAGVGEVTPDAIAAAHVPSTADARGAYKNASGPYGVGVLSAELPRDARDAAPLSILVRWPMAAPEDATTPPERFPLVIFSHGAGGGSEAFAELSDHWASHGYVVIHPTHSDSVKLRRERGERFDDPRNAAQQVVSKVRPRDRVADVKLILDSLDRVETLIAEHSPGPGADRDGHAMNPGAQDARPDQSIDRPGATPRLNRERIAIAGHSAGALTAQMVAGLRFTGRRLSAGWDFHDARIKAAVVISGQGLSRPALSADSWKRIEIPMIVYAGSEDRSPVNDETPAGRRHPFEYAPPGDKYLVYIDGATHGSYQGRQAARVLRDRTPDNLAYITDLVAFGTLSFLDAYLKDDPAARLYLTSGEIARYPGGRVEFRQK